MNRCLIEKIYDASGLTDRQLRNIRDLLIIHRIDVTEVLGYENLNQEKKEIFEKFMIKYWNNHGIGTRLTMYPQAIYEVQDDGPKPYLRFDLEMNGEKGWVRIYSATRFD